MALQSQLFRGEPKLEAAANIDSAHITPGARGPHVEKIQTALNILDNAGLGVDGDYGPATANAVLNYKTKRNIVNYSYQTSADNIVGKMTVAKLDEEMLAHETQPPVPIQLIPISPRANIEKAYPRLNFQLTASKALIPVRTAHVLPTESITIDEGQTAEIEIKNGKGYYLTIAEALAFAPFAPHTAVLIVPGVNDPTPEWEINVDSVRVKVRGVRWGTAILQADKNVGPQGPNFHEQLVISVRDPRPPVYHPTTAHHHEPVTEPDEWNKVCKEAESDPDLAFILKVLARNRASPPTIANAARVNLLFDARALAHFDYYLGGGGGVVNEDDNIKVWIERDSNARKVISRRIIDERRGNDSPVKIMFEFKQEFFDNDDARKSFGTIDNLEVAADFVMGTVEIWFEDTYEWHPPYSQYTRPFRCPDKVTRDTNFGHAALVQMKTRGANDFQMRGKATFPMRLFPGL
jgi:hypothetical protein